MPVSSLAAATSASGVERLESRDPAPDPQRFAQALAAGEADRASAPTGGVRPPAQLTAPARTALSGEQARDALAAAYRERRGREPSRETLAVLTAQWAHETARGEAMYNYNFGGIKGSSPEGLTTRLRTREGSGVSEVRIVDGFRAYSSASAGAADYLSLLERRYPEALAAADRGDPEGFVRGLAQRGYFTGSREGYTRSVSQLTSVALRDGFGALGGAAGELPALERRAFPGGFSALAAGESTSLGVLPGELPFVGVDALADELSRAALRIARAREQDPGERDVVERA